MTVSLRRVAAIAVALTATLPAGASGARPTLDQPYDILALPGGKLVVTDLPKGLVYELDPGRHTGRVLARIPEARELERLPDGRILVTSRARVLALDTRTGKTSVYAVAHSYLLGIALAPGGRLYASENVPGHEETTVVLLRHGVRSVLAENLRGVHGILVTTKGLILGESYAGRVLRLDPKTRQIEVLATGLVYSGFTLEAPGGGLFVSELGRNRISRIGADGHVTKVSDVFQPGPIAFDSRHRIVGLSQDGTIFRIVRGHARTIYP